MSRAMQELGALIRTQDNAGTENPLFVVFEMERIYTRDDSEGHEWRNEDWTERADDETATRLDEQCEETDKEPDGWNRCQYIERNRFLTACLSRKGAEHYIAINGHNLTRPHIYVMGLFRNEEMIKTRRFLMSLPESE